jgi:uncharacterized protein (TIGR03084 family)
MAADLGPLCADLATEHADLDRLVAGLDDPAWDTPTPAEGWSIRDQVGHLAYFDDRATLAVTDPDAFAGHLAEVLADLTVLDRPVAEARRQAPAALLARWRGGRERMVGAFRRLDPGRRIAWYGPEMGAASFVTARLMETWCHGQDVADALGAEREPTGRLRHIAHLAVRARPFNYASHGRRLPDSGVRVELRAPGGGTWTWGEPGWPDLISGDALDFCLVATQRRHRDDTDLRAEGALAGEWLEIIQAFAGPPGPGRRAGQFARRPV